MKKKTTKRHPMQPLEKDKNGVLRFKKNAIVEFLLENGEYDLNKLAGMRFSREDEEQFSQLIGYSLSGFSELSYVSEESFELAQRMADGQDEKDAHIELLKETLNKIRDGLKEIVPNAFFLHPDAFKDLIEEAI